MAEINIEIIASEFELCSYRLFGNVCPAVYEKTNGLGYCIRIRSGFVVSKRSSTQTFEYFDLDSNGIITKAPKGLKKRFKGIKVADIKEAVNKYRLECE